NEAEKLFRAMEAKIANAKSIECDYDASFDGSKGPIRGKLRLSDGNKSRTETLPLAHVLPDSLIICDGKNVVVIHEDVPAETRDAPKWLPDMVRGKITRSFTVLDAEKLAKQPDFKLDEQFAVADFKLGKRETVGEAEARTIEFKLTLKGSKRPIAVSL